MPYYAQFIGNICTSVTETHSELPASDDLLEIDGLDISLIGGTRSEDGLSVIPLAIAAKRHLSQLGFINRFTDAEAIAIDLASIGATVDAATIRRYLSKVQAAKFIDLDDADVTTGVAALESVGLIGTGRAAEILADPILDSERP